MGLFDKGKNITVANNNSSDDKLQEFIEFTKNTIITLSDSIDNVNSGMAEANKDSKTISDVVVDVSGSTEEQLRLVQNTSDKIDEIYSTVDKIIKSIQDVQDLAASSNEAVDKGRDNLNAYKENISVITDSMNNTADFIGKLRDNISEIVDTIKIIVGISNQLNMLSLNSSIEAARAGEAGKGFAVVAQQITVLSNDTKEGIGTINSILGKILENSSNVEDSIHKSIDDFEGSVQVFEEAISSFEEITEKNHAVLKQIDDVSAEVNNISDISKATQEVSRSLSDSAEEITNKTDEVTQIVSEEIEHFGIVNTTVDNLKDVLAKLETLVDRYNSDIKPTGKTPSQRMTIGVISPAGHEFWLQIREGIMYAKKELAKRNCDVDYIAIEDLTLEKYVNAMNKCIDKKYAGIALVGYYEELAPVVDKAVSKGIPCITFNSEFETKSKRLCFVGQNAYDSGVISANTLAEKIGNKGRVLVVTSDKRISNHEIRRSGFNDTIKKYKDIQLVGLLECHDSNDEAYEKVKEFFKKDSNIDGIYIVAGGQIGTAKVVEEAGRQGKTKIILYDFMRNILELISKGTVTAAIGQDPFRQGHDPLIYIYNKVMAGQNPPEENMWTKIDVVDRKNVGNYL